MMRNASILVVGATLILLGGCRKAPQPTIVEVEGFVRLDGKPLNRALVRFVPSMTAGPEYWATAVTDESGHFQLACKGKPGACAGENRVIVVEAELPNHLKGSDKGDQVAAYLQSLGGRPLPPQYANLVDSPLTVEVSADQKEYTLDLTR